MFFLRRVAIGPAQISVVRPLNHVYTKNIPPIPQVVVLLGVTLFTSAFLLFWCQPMVAKMVLPLLGGAASIWTTCVLFFQVMLLTGYVYAYVLANRLKLNAQFVIHGGLVLSAVAFLPIEFSTSRDASMDRPVVWLLGQLLIAIGLPFFVLSTTAPLLQNWLARTKLEIRRNPYVLYASSNAGSLLSLVLYPFIVEPQLGVERQSGLWTIGYGILLLMTAASAFMVWRNAAPVIDDRPPLAAPETRTRAYWLAAAFVPSALMLSVTNNISMNLASIPFLWILPLAVYLATFVLTFAETVETSVRQFGNLSRLAPLALLLLLPVVRDVGLPTPALNWLLMIAHITVLFFGAYLCHTALAASRPDPAQLTEFYFWLALGGALGGVFAAVIAPSIFNTVFEYPLLVATLPFFRQRRPQERPETPRDVFSAVILGLAFITNWYVGDTVLGLAPDVAFFLVLLLYSGRRLRFALSFGVILLGYALTVPAFVEIGERIYVTRNFFGVKKVLVDRDQNLRMLLHGDTLHGAESLNPRESGEPMSYFHRAGPVGEVMSMLDNKPSLDVGVVGLGAGSMAAYGDSMRKITFFEVDRQVEEIAAQFFTFLRRCGANCSVMIADGRRALEQQPNARFDVLMVDAFNSDSIPPHLVSREALQLYLTKMKPDGLLVFHVSNRYLRVLNLISNTVEDAGLMGLSRTDREELFPVKASSEYIVAARRPEDVRELLARPTWKRVLVDPSIRVWTDDYSNMLQLIKWN